MFPQSKVLMRVRDKVMQRFGVHLDGQQVVDLAELVRTKFKGDIDAALASTEVRHAMSRVNDLFVTL